MLTVLTLTRNTPISMAAKQFAFFLAFLLRLLAFVADKWKLVLSRNECYLAAGINLHFHHTRYEGKEEGKHVLKGEADIDICVLTHTRTCELAWTTQFPWNWP